MGDNVDSNPRQHVEEQEDVEDIARKPLSDAAKRALAEAEERRLAIEADIADILSMQPDPAEYGATMRCHCKLLAGDIAGRSRIDK